MLAKGIYDRRSHWYPADFAEVMNHIERERREHYLDGPNDVDWILIQTPSLSRCEDNLYVGYSATIRRSSSGERYWMPPRCDDTCRPYL